MIHIAAELHRAGGGWAPIWRWRGPASTAPDAPDHDWQIHADAVEDLAAELGRRYRGREHVTVWSTDAWALWLAYCGGRGDAGAALATWSPRLADDYLIGATSGRVHLRDVRAWGAEGPWPSGSAERAAAVLAWRRRVDELGRGLGLDAVAGTASGAAHAAWRAWTPGGAWRRPSWASTVDLDRARSAMYGGRAGPLARRPDAPGEGFARGDAAPSGSWRGLVTVHDQGWQIPEIEAVAPPWTRLPPGWTLRRVDQRAAYPWAIALGLPRVWQEPDRTASRDAVLAEGRAGVALATVLWDGRGEAAARLPVHLRRGQAVAAPREGEPGRIPARTDWRDRVTARGWYTCSTLREVERCGGFVDRVHDAYTWAGVRDVGRDYVVAVHEMAAAQSDANVKASIKRLTSRLYGRWARDRSESQWREDPVGAAWRRGAQGAAVHGDWIQARVEGEDYPIDALPWWAAEITSRVAIALARTVDRLTASGAHALYVDTDSVIIAAPPGWASPLVDQSRIGDWREDWTGRWVCILDAKWYALDGRSVLAGVPRALQAELLAGGRATCPRTGRTWHLPRWTDDA